MRCHPKAGCSELPQPVEAAGSCFPDAWPVDFLSSQQPAGHMGALFFNACLCMALDTGIQTAPVAGSSMPPHLSVQEQPSILRHAVATWPSLSLEAKDAVPSGLLGLPVCQAPQLQMECSSLRQQ